MLGLRIVAICTTGLLFFAFADRAFSQQADAGAEVKFCDSNDAQGRGNCLTDPPLQQKVAAATELFQKKEYSAASQAYLTAFADTPLRPVNGSAHGLMIASLNQTKQYEQAIEEVLRRDRLLGQDDYRLWADLAFVARGLATSSSVNAAQQTLMTEFQKFPSKLKSRVWALLPAGTVRHLMEHKYSLNAVYPRDTEQPEIRRAIEKFIATSPTEPFIEFAYLTIGQYDEALAANPKSIIADVLEYAKGFQEIGSIRAAAEDYLAKHPNQADSDQRLGSVLPDFEVHAGAARPHFEAVLRFPLSLPHADDAAFWLGWLAYQEGRNEMALRYFSQAMLIGNGDYKLPAVRFSIKIIDKLNPQQTVAAVTTSQGLSTSEAAWYVASRAAYRQFDYASAIDIAKRALNKFNVPFDRLPSTTDREQIEKALDAILYPIDPTKPKQRTSTDAADDSVDWHPIDRNLQELPYIVQASTELSEYEIWLKSVAALQVAEVSARAHAIIAKFSITHIDYRQAIRAIDMSLDNVPRKDQFKTLREWLYYRKIRVLLDFAPDRINAAVAAMESEFPQGRLMDDALAEKLFAEITIFSDANAARNTFKKIKDNFPNGNAPDNAYNWMSIMLYCSGRAREAKANDLDIIKRFPLTRHAYYAVTRLAKPPSPDCSDRRYLDPDRGDAYQTIQDTAVYVGPSKQNAVLRKLSAGARLAVSEKQDDWYTVRLGRTVGYVPKADVTCVSCSRQDDSDNQK